MKNYSLLIQLISVAEQLENEHGQEKEFTLNEFADYLKIKTDPVPADGESTKINLKHVKRSSDVINLEKRKSLENNISRLLLLLVRHARNYAKKAFEHTPLQTLEEFSYLAMLYNTPSITKSELIARNFQEKTSGTEVIRRLLHNDMASQSEDNIDKRSKRVMITPAGKKMLETIFQDMGTISELLVYDLTKEEREYLLAILQKMDKFHQAAFPITRQLNMEELKDFKG